MTGSATRTVQACWEGGMRAVVQAGRFDVVADEPLSAGGGDTGPQPTDLFLASIASCFALAMAYAARRRGHELEDLHVTVVGTYDGPRFSRIGIAVGSAAPSSILEELLPEAERVCYVTNSLRTAPQLDIGLVATSRSGPEPGPAPGRAPAP